MAKIGETLRDARIRQGVEIKDVEERTKIRAKYLRALENEEFELLPGPTFARSFLKSYAEHLGLDARVLVEQFRSDYEDEPDDDPMPAFASEAPPGRRRDMPRYERRPLGMAWIVGGVIAAVLVLFLVLGLTGDDGGDGSQERGGGSQDSGGSAEQSADRNRAERRSRRRRSARQRARAQTVSLKITPDGPTYACLDRGEGEDPIFEGSLSSARTFRGKRLRLNLGRPSARVRANGRTVDLGSENQPVGFSFSPGKRPRALPLGQRPCV